jgi:uncharacterized membrane protein YidH (DUF202 family)
LSPAADGASPGHDASSNPVAVSGATKSADDAGRPPGLAAERTELAWTRSALNMAASGLLIARSAFVANLDALGVASAIAMALMAFLTWHHGQSIYRRRGLAAGLPHPQASALRLLTAATIVTAAVAILVTVAI